MIKKQLRKHISLYTCFLIIVFSLTFSSFTVLPMMVQNDDELDQYQLNCSQEYEIRYSSFFAQSFIPNLSQLSRVRLFISVDNTPVEPFIFCIRNSLDGKDLVRLSVPSRQLPSVLSWVEFDFPDISLQPGQQYFLIGKVNTTIQKEGNYLWGASQDDRYTLGKAYQNKSNQAVWEEINGDLCFKTYGYDHPPNKPKRPMGETDCKTAYSYEYHTQSNDEDDDSLFYQWDFGDGTLSDWMGPFESFERCEVEHRWNKTGTFQINVRAKDETYQIVSDWSEPLNVSVTFQSAWILGTIQNLTSSSEGYQFVANSFIYFSSDPFIFRIFSDEKHVSITSDYKGMLSAKLIMAKVFLRSFQ